MDAEQLRENAHKMVDFIADYYKSLESFPVLSQVKVKMGHFPLKKITSYILITKADQRNF